MNKFDRIYEEIINDKNKSLPSVFDISSISNLSTPRYRWFNVYSLLNEYVENEELTPIHRIVGYEKSLKRSKIFQEMDMEYILKIKIFLTNYFKIK